MAANGFLVLARGWRSAGVAVTAGMAAAILAGILVFPVAAAESARDATSSPGLTKSLVESALRSEVAGDNQQCSALLKQAVLQSPDDAAVHWQLGHVHLGNVWQSPEEAAETAGQDTSLASYRRKRDSAGDTAEDQAALARWCGKSGLVDEQRAHWWRTLAIQPNNAEAIKSLGFQLHQGLLISKEQAKQIRWVEQAKERWQPQVSQLRRAVERHDAPPPDVLDRIAKISDRTEMLGLERAVWQQVGGKSKRIYHDMTLAMIEALAKNPCPAASESLVRHAVFSDAEDIRTAAIDELKCRSMDHYVPLLLSALQSPMDVSVQYTTDAGGNLVVRRSVSYDGPLADFSVSLTLAPVASRMDVILKNPSPTVKAAFAGAWQKNRVKSEMQAAQDAAATREAVDQANREIDERNQRVFGVLTATTGQDLGTEPTPWWTWWWQDYNESYELTKGPDANKPHYAYETGGGYAPTTDYARELSYYLGVHSCFAPGTKVWTLTGSTPIEQVKIGDRVLSQDIETGELAYKPVLATTLRKPGPRVRIGLGSESITTTPGHPFWAVGQGWQLAKQLEVGKSLHSLAGGVPIDQVEKLKTDESYAGFAYNLIVADFSSYFVGEKGFLVHDNTPRKPTAALLPGLAP